MSYERGCDQVGKSPDTVHDDFQMCQQGAQEPHPEFSENATHPKTVFTREMCEAKVEQFIRENSRRPRCSDFNRDMRYPSYTTFQRIMGQSLYWYCMERYPELTKIKKIMEPAPLSREVVVERLATRFMHPGTYRLRDTDRRHSPLRSPQSRTRHANKSNISEICGSATFTICP